jgi:amphi-Trp domain-containing protein
MSNDKEESYSKEECSEKPQETDHETGKTKISHATNLEFHSALNVLEQFLETARDGRFTVESDGKVVDFVASTDVALKIKAKEENGRQSVSFKLAWPSDSAASADGFQGEQTEPEGDVCVADQLRMNRDASEREEAELERRFERELFGGCGCVEVPGPR